MGREACLEKILLSEKEVRNCESEIPCAYLLQRGGGHQPLEPWRVGKGNDSGRWVTRSVKVWEVLMDHRRLSERAVEETPAVGR